MNNTIYPLAVIGVIAVVTWALRAFPFLLFGNRPLPKVIRYLGKALPAAIFGMLVVYCLKNVDVITGAHGVPELIAIGIVTILHLWKRNMLLSIGGGTVCYMLLVQCFFS